VFTVNGEKIDMAENMRKGIYILPNLFTTGSLFAGFYGIVATTNGNFSTAAIWVLVSSIFDGLDGKVARLTGTSTKFGVEYDSLADLVAFGVAPGLLMYCWAPQAFRRTGLACRLFRGMRLSDWPVSTFRSTQIESALASLPIPVREHGFSNRAFISPFWLARVIQKVGHTYFNISAGLSDGFQFPLLFIQGS
jgi:CDP-diacylglycerol--serine O-phosphatidyltransferase